ncbi:hypothetical protein INR49_029691 [Caranx melampygus]|nr:hypothetical protein INR49_029691 [Caranx melampygus]
MRPRLHAAHDFLEVRHRTGVHQGVRTMAKTVKTFYDLTAKLLSGETFSFASLKGKVILIENVASL